VILNLSTEDGETTLSNNRVPCYLVKVEVSNEIGRPTVTFYLVRADTQSAAIKAVEEVLPGTWGAVEATLTAIRRETVEALDLRPGAPRQT
jgi:hypothetical protein